MGLLIEQCAKLRKGLLLYCCNQVWMKNGGRLPWNVTCYLRNIQDLLSDGKTPHERRFGAPFIGPVIPLGAVAEYHPISAERPVATASVRLKSLARQIPWTCVTRWGESGKETSWSSTLRNWRRWTHLKSMQKKTQCKGSVNAHELRKNHIINRRWNGKTFWRRSGSENIHLNPGPPRPRRRTRKSSRRIRRVFFNPTSRLIVVWWWS